jgi:predicted Zn finger-like uncharacterized protein
MEVICPKCNTTYDFEDTLIGPKGTVVRCTQCGHMFKIFRGGTENDINVAGWMIRKRNGPVYNVDRFSTLQKWILEGKVNMKDELSRTGKSWKKLGEIVELSGLFKISAIQGAPEWDSADAPTTAFSKSDTVAAAAVGRLEPSASVTPQMDQAWEEMDTGRETTPHREPSPEFQQKEEGTVKGPLARSLSVDPSALSIEDGESIMKPVIQPAWGKKIAVIVIVLVVLAPIAYFGFAYRAEILGWVGMLKEPKGDDAQKDRLKEARSLILADTDEAFDEAEKILKAVTDKNAQSLEAWIGLSEIYARRAQYLKDRIDFPQIAGSGSGDAAALQSDLMKLVLRAREYAREASKINPASHEALRTMADAMRLSGEYGDASKSIDKALDAKPNDAQSIYVQVLIDFDQDGDVENAIAGVRRALRKDEKLVPARYRLALLLAFAEKRQEAKKELDAVLDAVSDHGRAKTLLAAVEKGTLLASAADAATDEDAPPDAPKEAETAAVAVKEKTDEGTGAASGTGAVPAGKSFDYYKSQADKFANADNCSKALDYYQKALELNVASADAWGGRGDCYRDMGRSSEAANAYKQALKYNSRYGPAIIGLAEIYKQKGDYKQSLQYYKKYLEIFSSGPMSNAARQNVSQLEDLLKAKGEQPDEGGEETPPDSGGSEGGKEPESGTEGPTVIKTTEEEVKSSIGQPTSDVPKTSGDPYD